eukprot:CAMPEP_0175824720 /NCGR_PEP_ID=MMETSP0107_2-20121207/10872_1 /TAXON_ID=195067 ORGANISM="Goniomonas pacifica, Strain CCMP1869" /NCGR_SAMPLE_ID=MMETSP0107_2 /ASSEMBLY_ACC=CAM_ASM_000203 /LENGTH=125 /DNA_ID=CAMNT_0017137291 /DNA_START=11 /DNA_END=388 /DNA_ORIENTATION=+
MPHDDDIDIGIFDKDRDAFIAALPFLSDAGFALCDVQGPFFYKLCRNHETVDVDIAGVGHYCHANSGDCEDLLKTLDEFTTKDFQNVTFNVPTEPYFVLLYNEDWMVPKVKWKPPIKECEFEGCV